MQIDDLAGNTVKITLDPSDMDGYHIKSEDISGHSRATELAISRLISCLSEDHDLGLCGERLLVEAFPKSDGGCTLYISCLKGATVKASAAKQSISAIICEGSLCVLARLCRALRNLAKQASLYAEHNGGSYRLMIYPAANGKASCCISRISHIISEYGLPLCTDVCVISDTEEYYTLLTDKALDIMPDYF